MSDLPDRIWFTPTLNKIADAAGERAALILGTERAAQEFYVPHPAYITRDHWIAKLVGLDKARAIAEVFGGGNIQMPASLGGEKRKRAQVLAQMIADGRSVNQITRVTGVSRQTVYNHRAKQPDEDDPQGSLF